MTALLMVGLLAQRQAVLLRVEDRTSGRPLPQAVATTLGSRQSFPADRLGRIRMSAVAAGDSLVIAAIGFSPDTIIVRIEAAPIVVRLAPLPLRLAELTIGIEAEGAPTPSITGSWVLPRLALTTIPAAVEADPLRALAVMPSVSYSTPLSARPVIRGYDAGDNVIRIDGFEILNPYHLARAFSSFAADFTESVVLRPLPHEVTDGETLAGVVDLAGIAAGEPARRNGGVEVTLSSVTGWQGWRGQMPGFAGLRLASLNLVSGAVGEEIGYSFGEIYSRLAVPLPGRRQAMLTVFHARDELFDRAPRQGMEWSNSLVGQRLRLVDRARWGLDLDASWNRFALSGRGVEHRHSEVDFANLFERFSLGLDARGSAGGRGWHVGSRLAHRRIDQELSLGHGTDLPATTTHSDLLEWTAVGSLSVSVARFIMTLGARFDASSSAAALQPRLRLTRRLGRHASVAIAAARASRLYQIVSDPQPEPTIAFFDFWLNAGEPSTPVPAVNHVSAEFDFARGLLALHAGVYASSGSGLGELRPSSDPEGGFRFGDSRTAGLEFRVARVPAGPRALSLVVSYAVGTSERRWADGRWRPWRLDHRHRLRLQADVPVSSRLGVFTLGEIRSAQPVTRVNSFYYSQARGEPGDSTLRISSPSYVFEEEGSERGRGVFWLDVGTRLRLDGPWSARTAIGLSVTNLTFGPVAPLEPVHPFDSLCSDFSVGCPSPSNTGVRYQRRFDLPAIPSLTIRVEF